MPIFNNDVIILLKFAHLFDFLMFFDQKIRVVKITKKHVESSS